MWEAASEGISQARKGKGPSFLLARCPRLEGHFLGDPLLRMFRQPKDQAKELTPMLHSLQERKGASMRERFSGVGAIMSLIGQTAGEQYLKRNDPVKKLRRRLKSDKSELIKVEKEVQQEIQNALEEALSS